MSSSNADIILAGAAAAFTIDLLIYPLDTIKTRYQSQDFRKTFATCKQGAGASAKQASPVSFRGLYQGVGSVIVATLPAAAVFFTTYEATKTLYAGLLADLPLPKGLAVPTPMVHALASGTAELASCLVLTPAEVIKQNAQMLRSSSSTTTKHSGGWRSNSTSVQALRMMSSQGGGAAAAHRMLTGYSALAARNLPFTALQFPVFEAVRRRLWARRDSAATVRDGGGRGGGKRRVERGAVTRGLLETGQVNALSAAVSGAVAAVVTTPMDVVKTRMMLSPWGESAQGAPADVDKGKTAPGRTAESAKRQAMSDIQVARAVYHESGIKGLFRGGLLRASWTAIGSGLYLGTYEVAKAWLKGTADDGDEEM